MARIYRYLSRYDRSVIEAMLRAGQSVVMIARALGRAEKPIYREIRRGTNENGEYIADYAQAAFEDAQRRKGQRKNESN